MTIFSESRVSFFLITNSLQLVFPETGFKNIVLDVSRNIDDIYLCVKRSRFDLELRIGESGPGSIQDAIKDPPSACGVDARKIRGSQKPLVGL